MAHRKPAENECSDLPEWPLRWDERGAVLPTGFSRTGRSALDDMVAVWVLASGLKEKRNGRLQQAKCDRAKRTCWCFAGAA